MFPELSIPKNARMGKKKILQPTALKVLFDVDTRLYYGKLVFDEYIYAYRFAVATGVRPGELVGLWYGDIKGNTVNLRRSINRLDEETTGKNENARSISGYLRQKRQPDPDYWPCRRQG